MSPPTEGGGCQVVKGSGAQWRKCRMPVNTCCGPVSRPGHRLDRRSPNMRETDGRSMGRGPETTPQQCRLGGARPRKEGAPRSQRYERSMAEVPYAREHHRQAVLVARL